MQEKILNRRRDLQQKIELQKKWNSETELQMERTENLFDVFRGIDLAKNYVERFKKYTSQHAKTCEEQNENNEKELAMLGQQYLLCKVLLTQTGTLLDTCFSNKRENVEGYLGKVKEIFEKGVDSDPEWQLSFDPPKPQYQECLVLSKKIDSIWQISRQIVPTVPSLLYDMLQPNSHSSKKKEIKKKMDPLNFRARADGIRTAKKKIMDEWETTPAEKQRARMNEIKTLAIECIDTIQARLEQNYEGLIGKLKKAFLLLQPQMEQDFLGKKTLGEYFAKSYILHQEFWNAYPDPKEREQLIDRFLLLITNAMKKMEIDSLIFRTLASGFFKEQLEAYEKSPKPLQETLKFLPFFEIIPLLLTLFYAAGHVDQIRPFLDEHFKEPKKITDDLELLGIRGDLPLLSQKMNKNHQKAQSPNPMLKIPQFKQYSGL